MISDLSEQLYEERIFRLASERKNEVFYNSSEKHAMVVHQALMQYAQNHVYIFCGNLNSNVLNDSKYCELVRDFLKNSNRIIKILLTGERNPSDDINNNLVKNLLSCFSHQVEIKKSDRIFKFNDAPVHFAVADRIAFRVETDIKQRMAFGNFNSPKQAGVLEDLFMEAFNSRESLPIALQ